MGLGVYSRLYIVAIDDAGAITYNHWNEQVGHYSSYRTTGGAGQLISVEPLPMQTGSGSSSLTYDGTTIRLAGNEVVATNSDVWGDTPPAYLTPIGANSSGDVVFYAYWGPQWDSYDAIYLAYDPARPPRIVTQPLSQTVIVGTDVTLSVIAAGYTPLSYQWRTNGVAIAGARAASYSISNRSNERFS